MVDQCIVLNDGTVALTELCGISLLERLLRTLQQSGIRRATVISNTPELTAEHLARPSWPRAELEIEMCQRSGEFVTVADIVNLWPAGAEAVLVVRANFVLDARLIRRLVGEVGNVDIISDSGAVWSGIVHSKYFDSSAFI